MYLQVGPLTGMTQRHDNNTNNTYFGSCTSSYTITRRHSTPQALHHNNTIGSSAFSCIIAFSRAWSNTSKGPAFHFRHNCMSSVGLSAEFAPNWPLVSHPHEWELDGEDGREVMPPAKGSPLAKLPPIPRLSQKFLDCSHYSTHECVRDRLQMARGTDPHGIREGSGLAIV